MGPVLEAAVLQRLTHLAEVHGHALGEEVVDVAVLVEGVGEELQLELLLLPVTFIRLGPSISMSSGT